MKIKQTRSAGGVVLNKKGQILIAGQCGTSWSLPKGQIEVGENSLETAKREIKEETGINQLQFIKKLGVIKRTQLSINGKKEDKSIIKTIDVFLFKPEQNDLKPEDPQNPEARWVDKNEVTNLLTHPKDKEFFLSIINQI
ncbi:MAG: NUDIX hydrolase [Bacteroidetes bacterium]|nr:NUDIX hydrolase [Bacteroidota bacterium]